LGNAETEGGAGVIGRSLTVHAKEPFGNATTRTFKILFASSGSFPPKAARKSLKLQRSHSTRVDHPH
jgi:hypothetical protein